jgi:hypothetical protein
VVVAGQRQAHRHKSQTMVGATDDNIFNPTVVLELIKRMPP